MTPEPPAGESPARSSVAEPRGRYRKRRIYADPSVFTGYEDEQSEKVQQPSRRSFADFRPAPTDNEDREAMEEMLSIITADRTRKAPAEL